MSVAIGTLLFAAACAIAACEFKRGNEAVSVGLFLTGVGLLAAFVLNG